MDDKIKSIFRKIYFLVGKEFWIWNYGHSNLSDEDERWLADDIEWHNWMDDNEYWQGENTDEVFTDKFIREVIECTN